MRNPLNLILPIYRPKPGWETITAQHLAAVQRACREAGIPLTVFLVNDGSSEKDYFPEPVLDTLKNAVDHFNFLSYFPNHGKGYSLRYGVSHSGDGIQIYTDYDFPFGHESILTAYRMLDNGAEVVMGERSASYTACLPPFRRMLSNGMRRLNSLLLGLPLRHIDTQSGLKGFRGKGRLAFLMTTVDTFLFDTEFILIAWRNRLQIEVIPLQLRDGLHFSTMGFKVMFRELGALMRVFCRCRIGRGVIRRMEKAIEDKRDQE